MLDEVREPLLAEAQKSPSLLSDLAGLEQYVAESYDSRSFVELLQNADDAGASRFVIQKTGDFVIVANDGRQFTQSDLESLCRSAASSKIRGSSIGYRGIGFKSVVSFARTIHLVSGELATTFSRERTVKVVPEATRVPLVRIPHPLEEEDRRKFSVALDRLLSDGLSTAFVFDNLLAAPIESEFSSFDPTSLLFLRNVRHVELRANTETVITLDRKTFNGPTRLVQLNDGDRQSEWQVIEQSGVEFAFKHERGKIIRLDERQAIVHAFLPTSEATGLGVKIHGDISTDPSRMRIIFDDRTSVGLQSAAKLIVALLEEGVSRIGPLHTEGMIAALVPFSDPRITGFQRRSFKTELLTAIKRCAEGRFGDLRFRPIWLNAVDFETLSDTADIRVVPRSLEDIEGLQNLMRFLDAKEATFDELSISLASSSVTIPGAAELVAKLSQRYATKQMDITQMNVEWRLWPVAGKVFSFAQAIAAKSPLDPEFVDMLVEKSNSGAEAYRLITAICDAGTARALLPNGLSSPSVQMKSQVASFVVDTIPQDMVTVQRISLKKWRSAEQQILSLLAELGWDVEDVSRQNIGYDIEGKTPEGEAAFVEVKSIDYPGQPFTLTSNEEAVARQIGIRYRLAIVRQAGDFLEVAFICDPIQTLKLTRQCRQWVWECSDYTFNPKRFELE